MSGGIKEMNAAKGGRSTVEENFKITGIKSDKLYN